MDAMNSSARTMWAGIEFQPDLEKPRKPVRLGVLSLTSNGDSVLIGRQPILDNRPPEFEHVSPVSLELTNRELDRFDAERYFGGRQGKCL